MIGLFDYLYIQQVIVMEDGRIKHQGSPDKVAQEDTKLYHSWFKISKSKV